MQPTKQASARDIAKLQLGLEKKVVIGEASSSPEARDFMESHIILVTNLNLGSAEDI